MNTRRCCRRVGLLVATVVLSACTSGGVRGGNGDSAAALALRSGLPGTWSAGSDPNAVRLAVSAELVVVSGPHLAIAEPIIGGIIDPLTGSGRIDLAGGWRLLVVGGRDLLPGLGPVRCVDVRASRSGTDGFAARFWRDEDLAASRATQRPAIVASGTPAPSTASESRASSDAESAFNAGDIQANRLRMVEQLAAIDRAPQAQRQDLLISWDRDWRAVRMHRLRAAQAADDLRR